MLKSVDIKRLKMLNIIEEKTYWSPVVLHPTPYCQVFKVLIVKVIKMQL